MKLVQVVVIMLAASAGAAAGAAQAAGPLWHRSVVLEYRVAPDGRASAMETWEVRADTASVAHTVAQQSFSYVADMDEVEVLAAYTRKADGSRIPVAPDAVLNQAVSTQAAAPQFSALAWRTIVFPAVAAGDTVHYELRRQGRETLFPGEFTLQAEPGGWATMERAEISLDLPAGMRLRVAASGLDEAPPEPGAEGGTRRSWHLSARRSGAVALDVSSFADYAALGRVYAARAWPHSEPGPAVQALADRLTTGLQDPREIALRLYRYVAAETRYVATFLGKGRVVPRPAETVLAEGWGDCKDHAALLQALLAAKGIPAEPALISLRSLYTLPDAPGLGALDHVITYIPALDLFLDSTAPYAPFGLLPAAEYDKPVVLAHPTEARLAHTPAMPPGAMQLATRTVARIGEDDTVSGHTTTSASGPQGIALRSMAAWFEGRGAAFSASAKLRQLGTPGTGRYTFEPPEMEAADYRVEGHFELEEPLAEGGAAAFAVPGGLGVFGQPGKVLLGAAPTEDGGHACFPGRETEEILLELPPGATVPKLPRDVEIQAGGAAYASTYRLVNGQVQVRREFTLEAARQFCTAAEFAPMLRVLVAARRDQQAQITLAKAEPRRVAHGE